MSQADGPAGMLSPGGTLPQKGAGSQNESWRSQEEAWRLRFRITELLNNLEEKLLFRQLFQEETERKRKKNQLQKNQSEKQSCRKEFLTQEGSKVR